MGNHVITIDFHGSQLVGLEDESGTFVALRPIVEGMGLDWSAQYRRVQRDAILAEGVAMMATPLGQEQVFLRLDLLHGWLFSIDAERVKPEQRERVLIYKRECYRALAVAFAKPGAADELAAAAPADVLDQDRARRLVGLVQSLFGDLAGRQLYIKLGLPTVPAMFGTPVQLPLFTYDAHPARPATGGSQR